MILKTEIRSGNWVSKDTETYKATTDTNTIIERGAVIEGVQLNRDWAVRLGAKKAARNEDLLFYNDNKIVLQLSFITVDTHYQTELANNFNNEWQLIDLIFVHQLQNLFFCLTGKELECVQ